MLARHPDGEVRLVIEGSSGDACLHFPGCLALFLPTWNISPVRPSDCLRLGGCRRITPPSRDELPADEPQCGFLSALEEHVIRLTTLSCLDYPTSPVSFQSLSVIAPGTFTDPIRVQSCSSLKSSTPLLILRRILLPTTYKEFGACLEL